MLTIIILAILSWTCHQTSNNSKTAPPVDREIAQVLQPISISPTPKQVPTSEIETGILPIQNNSTGNMPMSAQIEHAPASHLVVSTKEDQKMPVETVETAAVPLSGVKERLVKSTMDHRAFAQLLGKYVDDAGKVDYNGLQRDVNQLDAYLDALAANPAKDDWPKNEKLAYWINVYNAFTLKLILDHLPVTSITEIEGGKPWDKKWIRLGEQTYSLNQIENDIIRPQFNEPRIHFAVNCAAKSCPPLANEAFTAANLDNLLDSQTKKFINNTTYNDLKSDQIRVSKIFDWYGSDFGNVIDFINKYAEVPVRANAKMEFMEYNWKLNN